MLIEITTEYTWALYLKYLRFCISRDPHSKIWGGAVMIGLLLCTILVIAISYFMQFWSLIKLYLVLLVVFSISICAAPAVRYLLLMSERGREETLRFTYSSIEAVFGIPTRQVRKLYVWTQVEKIWETDDFFCLAIGGTKSIMQDRLVDKSKLSSADLTRLSKLLSDKASSNWMKK